LMGLALDRWGSIVLPIYAIVGAGALPMTGLAGSAVVASAICVFFVGFAILGFQVGMSSCAALIYPTDRRSRGMGLAFSIGRLGAICGPLIAGALMGGSRSALELFSFPVMPFLAAGLAFVCITICWTGSVR